MNTSPNPKDIIYNSPTLMIISAGRQVGRDAAISFMKVHTIKEAAIRAKEIGDRTNNNPTPYEFGFITGFMDEVVKAI